MPGLVVIAIAGYTSVAGAQVTSEQQSAIRGSCRSDFQSKCAGVTPGGKDALACLQKNVAALSPACKTAVSATIPAPATPAEAKPAPTATPPAAPPPAATAAPTPPLTPAPAAKPAAAPSLPVVSVPPPKAKVAQPQRKPAPAAVVVAPAAAPAAKPAEMPTPQQIQAIKSTCRKDFATYCKGVPQGGPEALGCLQRNNPRLLPACKTSLAAAGDAVPPPAAVAPAPTTRTPNAPVVMTAVIGRSCARDLILHCRDIKVGDGQKIACLMERGPKLSILCKAALKITEPIR